MNSTVKEEHDSPQHEHILILKEEAPDPDPNPDPASVPDLPIKPGLASPPVQIPVGDENPSQDQEVGDQKISSSTSTASTSTCGEEEEEDKAMPGTVFHLYLHQTPDNQRQKMKFPELCRKYRIEIKTSETGNVVENI